MQRSWLTLWNTNATLAKHSNPPAPLRTLHFGQHHEGLVTFLVYPPDDLVLVVRLQWLGD